VLLIVLVEVLIRVGVINRYIVPMPSQIIGAFERVILEEEILHRFVMTGTECLAATVLLTTVGVTLGFLLHRVKLLRDATETWIAAMASAHQSSSTTGATRPRHCSSQETSTGTPSSAEG